MKAQRELLASEDVKSGVPHGQKDYSATNPAFLDTSWGWQCSSGARSKGSSVPVVVHTLPTACTLVPLHGEPAFPASMLPAWPRCAGLPALAGKTCLLQLSHHCVGQASSEQDTIDTVFDPPALTLTCFLSQTVPMKAFFVNFHCISTPIPENFLSTQWGFG